MIRESCAVSAPGKVLIAGGYLVLDRAFTGLVFGLDARIHIVVKEDSQGIANRHQISVASPQFSDPSWDYDYKVLDSDKGVAVTQLASQHGKSINRNPFVETTLRYVLSYIIANVEVADLGSAVVSIFADNDYYTSPSDVKSTGRKFHNFAIPLNTAHKTGLGSSAALVTALAAGLLRYYIPHFDLENVQSRRSLHNLAQVAHCAAQGKVGSGFDVASAVYGSCVYRRFSPALLSSLPDDGTAGFTTKLLQLIDETGDTLWDMDISKNEIVIPVGLRMVMCDVSCGSQTPGMVKKVLAWRSEDREAADSLWSELHAANIHLATELRHTAQTRSGDFSALSAAFANIRRLIRKMGEASQVAIEPPAQTRLIDACCKIEGVIGGTVPGAGGYDAIVLLIRDDETVVSQLRHLFSTWQFGDDVGEGRVSMLGVREEMQGVRGEDVAAYDQ